jgi:hypothetical protein
MERSFEGGLLKAIHYPTAPVESQPMQIQACLKIPI